MSDHLTPAAQRALAAACVWHGSDESASIELPEALWGLLAEPDTRAALLLAAHGIDAARLAARWPRLAEPTLGGRPECDPAPRAPRLSASLRAALDWATERLWELPQPLELSTEHLLLGMVGQDSEAAQWLRAQGLDAGAIEAEIHRSSGLQPGPLPWIDEPPVPPAPHGSPPGPARGVRSGAPAAAPESIEPREPAASVWRILDAAANRAAEGLRVVEDYLRLGLDDRHLTAIAKTARHRLTEIVESLPLRLRLAARDVPADVGTTISTEGELQRRGLIDVPAASLKRVQQALRSLEEYAKLAAPDAAARFEQLRYETYTLERAVGIVHDSSQRLADARLYVLIDGRESVEAFRDLAEALVDAGVDVLQLRDKRLCDRELLARAAALVAATRGARTLAIINDRADIAALARADGVHVGQAELRIKEVRAIVGAGPLAGVSTHSIEQARQAVLDGASYLGVGPIFPSRTKDFREFPGLEFARQAAAEIRLPSFAIGGISAENLPLVQATGIGRIAVSSAVVAAPAPAEAARNLKRALVAAS